MNGSSAGSASYVRGYERSDHDAVVELELASFDLDPIPGENRAGINWTVSRIDADPGSTLVAVEDGRVVGVCTPRADALAVHPDHRRRGHGRRLVEAARELVGRQGLAELTLWGDPNRPSAAGFIEALGATYRSSLWLMRLPADRTVPPARFPDHVRVDPIRPDVDDEPYVAMLNRVFEDHPSPLSWSEDYIREIHARADFDAAGVLVVRDASDPDRLIGLCKTQVLPGDRGRRGEIGVVGLVPEWRGRGLGRQLLRWGIAYLRSIGLAEIELTVEARNAHALELYRQEGFEAAVEWPHWVLPALVPSA